MTRQFHTATILRHWDRFSRLVAGGALVVVNHSGGKDSQAQYAVIRSLVPADQIVVVHANLGDAEWPGVKDHIRATTDHPLHVTRAIWKDGTAKTLLNAIERRGRFPDAMHRYCTSDLKRGERIQAASLAGPVLADLAALGWSVHRLTGRLIYSVPVPGERIAQ